MKPLHLSEAQTGDDRQREIWAIGSGKGGTGKSFVTTSVALSLVKLGKKVILVDADLGCANLHTCLGMHPVSQSLSDFMSGRVASLADVLVPTPYPGLKLISGAHDMLDIANPTHSRKSALMKALDELEFDYLLLDLGAGTAFNTLDFFLAAHKAILVVVPEPTAIENAYRFIKSVYFRYMRAVSKELKLRQLVEEAMDPKNQRGVHSVHDLIEVLAAADPAVGRRLREDINAMRVRLVVNQVRTVDDLTLGFAMRSSVEKYFGIRMDYSGYVEYDDVVWKAARAHQTVMHEYPYSSPARCVDRLTRNLMTNQQIELESVVTNR
ncbi:MAG: P-loop NTPase [Nitrospirae bacterium]|nr:P-loop NTPase [Nitrospirota bacterium]